ncbi:hypothetical protein HHI36_016572 [Cryptolaemus montrouzieri]|uniref:Uncharacterized protein n=1 Tax=Cryptolaemus montrouzieri TaxID=559131 RepID=A0ABD2NKW4_9CUCU
MAMLDLHFPLQELRQKMWPWSDPSKGLKEIHIDLRASKKWRIVMTIICFLVTFSCIPVSGDQREIYCILYFFDNHDLHIAIRIIMSTLLFYAKAITSWIFPLPNLIAIVGIQDTKYAIMEIRAQLRIIEETFGSKHSLYYDQIYQKYVEIILKRCLKQHSLLLQ